MHFRTVPTSWLGVFYACVCVAMSGAGRAAAQDPIRDLFAWRWTPRTAPQKILHAHMDIPVKPGPLVLYYPEWIPGEHMPDGPIMDLAGLEFSRATASACMAARSGGHVRRSIWTCRRELTTLDVDLDFLLSAPATGFSAGASATSQLAVMSWNQVLLYPSGLPCGKSCSLHRCGCRRDGNSPRRCPERNESGDTISLRP